MAADLSFMGTCNRPSTVSNHLPLSGTKPTANAPLQNAPPSDMDAEPAALEGRLEKNRALEQAMM